MRTDWSLPILLLHTKCSCRAIKKKIYSLKIAGVSEDNEQLRTNNNIVTMSVARYAR